MNAPERDKRVSGHYPPDIVEQLRSAALMARWDLGVAIDRVTDELVRRGLARRRTDLTRASEWVRMRVGTRGLR